MLQYLPEFITVASIHLLAVMSPGPDFVMITRQAFTHSRRLALWSAVGLGLGIGVHVTYSLIGIGLLISKSILLFNLIKWAGAIYLIYLGIQSLKSQKHDTKEVFINAEKVESLSVFQAIRVGFLTNALNPKATIFFLAVFSQIISPSTPVFIRLSYGIEMILATILWFSFVVYVLSNKFIKSRFLSVVHIVERVTGAILIGLGIKVILEKS